MTISSVSEMSPGALRGGPLAKEATGRQRSVAGCPPVSGSGRSEIHNDDSGRARRVALHDRCDIAMSVVIQQSELGNDNAAVMRRVAEGESFVVTVNGRPVADVVPHRRDTGRRRFVPVAELAEAFATELVRDQMAWQTDLAVAEILGTDEPTDPFERRRH